MNNLNIINEQTNPPGPDWEKIDPRKKSEYEKKGIVKQGSDKRFYFKKSPEGKKEDKKTFVANYPSWATEDNKKCFAKFFNSKIETISDKLVGYRFINQPSEERGYLKSDGSLEYYTGKDGKTYTGFWKCENGKLIVATCEDKEITVWTGDKFKWNTDETAVSNMGCGKKPENKETPKKEEKPKKDEKPTQDKEEGKTNPKKDETPKDIQTIIKPEEKKSKIAKYGDETDLYEQVTKKEPMTYEEVYLRRAYSEYACIPSNFVGVSISTTTDGKKVLTAKGQETGNPYIFYADGTYENDKTGAKSTWPCDKLDRVRKLTPTCTFLNKFNVSCLEINETDFIDKINAVTAQLQKYVELGYKSKDIVKWFNMLNKFFADWTEINKVDDTILKNANYTEDDEFTQGYEAVETKYKNAIIYQPRGSSKLLATTGKFKGRDAALCTGYLIEYLKNAMSDAIQGGNVRPMPNLKDYQKEIIGCNNERKLKDFKVSYDKIFEDMGLEGDTPFEKKGLFARFKKNKKEMTYRDVIEFLKGQDAGKEFTGEKLPSNSVYRITLPLKESVDLNTKIKSVLNEVVSEKRNILVSENIVKNRVKVLLEDTEFKTRKQRNNFVNNLLQESFYLKTQGFDEKLIKEEFWDVVGGFFGKEKTNSVFTKFKTKMADWLVNHLSPKKRDGWIGTCIKRTIQDIDIRDLDRIMDCNFLSDKIANSIVLKLNEKMSNEDLKDGGIYDVVRDGMSDNVKSEKFKEEIKDKVKGMICEIVDDMSIKFDNTFDEMKKRAMEF